MCAQTYKQVVAKNDQLFLGEVLDVPLDLEEDSTGKQKDSHFGFRIDGGWNLLVEQLRAATATNVFSQVATYNSGLVETTNGNFTEVFRRLAAACSLVMQSPKNPDTRKVIGEAYGPEIVVNVRWFWMIMPLSIVFLSTIFIMFTIFRNWKTSYMYKNSSLATLFHGLEISALEKYEETFKEYDKETEGDMMAISKKMRVRLGCDRDGRLKLKE